MAETVTIRVKYLSAIRDQVGRKEETVEFPLGATLLDVQTRLKTLYSLSLPDPGIMLTLNDKGWTQLPEEASTKLKDSDVICIFPIISGG